MKCGRALSALLLSLALARPAAAHPLDPLSPGEIARAFALISARFAESAELPDSELLFPLLALREPAKTATDPAQPPARRAELQIFHWPSNRLWLADVDLSQQRVSTLERAPEGSQPALSAEEYEAAGKALRAHEPWQRALTARGVEPELAHIETWAAGHVALDDAITRSLSHGKATRLVRALTFAGVGGSKLGAQHPYVRPIDGLVALIDLNARRVVHMTDVASEQAVSRESGRAERAELAMKPLKVQAPRGPSFVLNGQEVRWGIWQFRVGLHPREGLVLYDVQAHARGQLRKVAQRMSLSEIYVPYGFPDAEWSWRSALDVGEYNAGMASHELEPERDVPAHARFVSATLASSRGPSPKSPQGHWRIARAIAIYERDAGLLWTRTEPASGARDTRVARELVVTWSTWIGNYIYAFDWIFKQDGSIEVSVQLTGTLLHRSHSARAERAAPKVGKDAQGVWIAAPTHQHFFNFRLDLDVDGSDNHVMESDLTPLAQGGFSNAFDKQKSALMAEGARDAQLERKWCVMSSSQTNVIGERPAYTLEPGASIKPLSRADYPGLMRAQFAKHTLWLTRFAEHERFAAGPFPNQASAADGVNRYVTPAEKLTPSTGDDVVLWYTLGLSHVPRLEDYPVMNVERVGFKLVPHGFFDRNPALGVPASPSARR